MIDETLCKCIWKKPGISAAFSQTSKKVAWNFPAILPYISFPKNQFILPHLAVVQEKSLFFLPILFMCQWTGQEGVGISLVYQLIFSVLWGTPYKSSLWEGFVHVHGLRIGGSMQWSHGFGNGRELVTLYVHRSETQRLTLFLRYVFLFIQSRTSAYCNCTIHIESWFSFLCSASLQTSRWF